MIEVPKIAIIKKGLEVELEIESLAYGGMGLARKENFVIFVKGAIPGQKVLAKIYKKRSGFAEARVQKILIESKKLWMLNVIIFTYVVKFRVYYMKNK